MENSPLNLIGWDRTVSPASPGKVWLASMELLRHGYNPRWDPPTTDALHALEGLAPQDGSHPHGDKQILVGTQGGTYYLCLHLAAAPMT